MSKKYHFTLRTRIYVSMLMMILLSFIVIGITTFFNFKAQNERYHYNRLERKENAVIKALSYFTKGKTFDLNDNYMKEFFRGKIKELADINRMKINMYSTEGRLLVASDLNDFSKMILPRRLTIDQLESIMNIGEGNIVLEQRLGEMEYLNSFGLIRDENAKVIAVINVPYFELKERFQRDLTSYMIDLSKIYGFLFIGASLLAYFLSQNITEPLKAISTKLKDVEIDKKNERLRWKSNDEIGTLVSAYNNLIIELEHSADLLAKSEREHAWREMAKQVAHEIKNPLTPMKLNVQFLERSISPDDPRWKEKITDFARSFIEQIDTLSSIATAFSNFASMPKMTPQVLDVYMLVTDTIHFFNKDYIKLVSNPEPACYIYADKGHFVRIMNNLIKNAEQAIPEGRDPRIELTIHKIEDRWRITVRDNGVGIPKEQRQKIFEPNFTTKNSGMGLGLAMVKNILTGLGGHIWFESEIDKGTAFFIELPAHNDQNTCVI